MTEMHPASHTTIVMPDKPRPTKELEKEATAAIRYLESFTMSERLDPELRMAMNDIKNTLKSLKQTVARQSEEAEANHEKMVEILRSINKRRD